MRALLTHGPVWVKDGDDAAAEQPSDHRRGNLVAADQVRFPRIPANAYGGVARPAVKFVADNDPLHVQDFGKGLQCGRHVRHFVRRPAEDSTARYGTLVAQVDSDGNDLGGVRNTSLSVPVGTYTGWNLFNKEFLRGRLLHS